MLKFLTGRLASSIPGLRQNHRRYDRFYLWKSKTVSWILPACACEMLYLTRKMLRENRAVATVVTLCVHNIIFHLLDQLSVCEQIFGVEPKSSGQRVWRGSLRRVTLENKDLQRLRFQSYRLVDPRQGRLRDGRAVRPTFIYRLNLPKRTTSSRRGNLNTRMPAYRKQAVSSLRRAFHFFPLYVRNPLKQTQNVLR